MRFVWLLAIAALLLSGTVGHASLVYPEQVAWAYKFTPGSILLTADDTPLAGVTFTNEPWKPVVGSSDVVATNLRVISDKRTSADPPSYDTLNGSGAYSLRLDLAMTDEEGTHSSAQLNFSGKLSGSFNSESANVTNVFGPDSHQEVTLGSYDFLVDLSYYVPVGPQEQTNAGSIAAHVTVYAAYGGWYPGGDYEGNPEVATVPEPATLVSSLLGLVCLGGAAWRRRRKAEGVDGRLAGGLSTP